MHGLPTLRGWLDRHEPTLSADTDDEALHWAGSVQRRSPHAMINVLWAEQLAAAEVKRASPSLIIIGYH